jgi:hypothetical protein
MKKNLGEFFDFLFFLGPLSTEPLVTLVVAIPNDFLVLKINNNNNKKAIYPKNHKTFTCDGGERNNCALYIITCLISGTLKISNKSFQ